MRIFLKLAFALFLLFPVVAAATHLRAGEIQVQRINCNSYTIKVKIIIYVNPNTSVMVGGEDDILSFGDGTRRLIPEMPRRVIDVKLGVGITEFEIEYTYAGPGEYLISYSEPTRNDGVVNIDSPLNSRFYVETMVILAEGRCNTYPRLLSPPIDRACQQLTFFHSAAAFDGDNDSLSYEIVIPKKDINTPVTNYRDPTDPKFYVLSNQGNEAGNGSPTFKIDPVTGLLTWDAPGMLGEYNVAIKIREWKRHPDGTLYEASFIVRDMQIIVSECNNKRPTVIVQEEVCVIAGQPLELKLKATDPDGDSVRVEFFSELLQAAIYQPEISPAANIGKFVLPPSEFGFKMNTSCARIRSKPYLLNVKVSDRNPTGSTLTRFYVIKIFVIAPPPTVEYVTVNPVSKQVSLTWSLPPCENIQSFQVWRRTSSINYVDTPCSNGMPAFLRYDLIAVVSQAQTNFVDRNLEIGSQYCYRIVAIANGIPGKLSLDTCLIPKPAEAPVITNVSIEDTDAVNGKMLVRWTSPFDIDKSQYPPPYRYQVLRQNETLKLPFEPIGSLQSDTTFIDQSINTSEYSYRYFVQLFVPTLSSSPLDSSSQASSIVAASISKVDQIDLRWSAKTPWSNYAEENPYHLIFRSTQKDGPFELIDSVNVLGNEFYYADRGRLKPLSRDPYFYKIKTRGTYGNPSVNDPLENFSQVIFGQLLDTIPPCAPVAVIEEISCNQFSCDGKSYFTSLKWESSNEPCNEDIVGYEIFVKSDTTSIYTSHGIVKETAYRHNNLSNLDYCYRIVAIDHVGNRSDSSVVVCNSSCVNFKLPNVITPGSDGQNDFLTVYDEENSTVNDCARSVTRVELLVYNRWGQEIFLKEINNQDTNIFWPGTTNTGTEVSAGTYYYKAKVDFQTSDPVKKTQEFKGWVHVLR
jgi:gliding motility-associated-like protein